MCCPEECAHLGQPSATRSSISNSVSLISNTNNEGAHMSVGLLLVIIGIILALLVYPTIGLVCILVGLLLLVWPTGGGGVRF